MTQRVSFVVPARNEQRWIGAMIDAVRANVPPDTPYEIIVADNGSVDSTADIARQRGADAVIATTGTVAAARNAGVARSRGGVLVFLDGDVMLTARWRERFPAVLAALAAEPATVTGSTVIVPERATWIEEHWFRRQQQRAHTHINSGHLITTRALFEQLGGFNTALETGEDADFTARARAAGARIVDDAALPAVHEGFPKSLRHFFRRELWHGKGDFLSLGRFLKSRIAQLGTLFLHLQLLALLAGAVLRDWRIPVVTVGACLLAAVLVAALRFRPLGAASLAVNGLLYYAYFLARGLSMYAVLFGAPVRRATR